jgi:hypothetical protein
MNEKKQHWENVYATKQPDEVSWTQEVPETSLRFIKGLNMPKDASIIDIGGGDSKLVDFLLDDGYTNITVLDISEQALNRAKLRLGDRGRIVKWIVSDVTEFEPATTYDIWHDRATFHFLTTTEQQKTYEALVGKAVASYMVIGTFSDDGPKKCSGLEIQQYNQASMTELFSGDFDINPCITENHTTPFNTTQNFIFCVFKRRTT